MAIGYTGNKNSNWISFSDVMTGLMVIFMFIAISYIAEVQEREKEINQIIEEYQLTQQKIYHDLDQAFTGRFEKYNLVVNPDLSIQITDAKALFPSQRADQEVFLTNKFKDFLDEFTPLFYDIILKPEYRQDISEVRIEGHTAISQAVEGLEYNPKYYQDMLVLSQKRSNKVLEFMMDHAHYSTLNKKEKSFLRFVTTSNGLSFGKALDPDGEFKFLTGRWIDGKKSMRVEFRVVTNNQRVIDEWIKKTE